MKYFILTLGFAGLLALSGCANKIEYQAPPQNSCTYEGLNYRYGEIFPASDGYNSCSCANDGTITCTEETGGNPAECKQDTDCERLNVDTSFCSDGSWACQEGVCDFSCSLDTLL